MKRLIRFSILLCCLATIFVFTAFDVVADEPYRPPVGQFPEFEKSKFFRGELVFVDHVNRRGSLRLHVDGHFHEGRLHHFAMLPYGAIWYRGAPAELRDIPIGTVLYGRFFLPPDEATSVVPIVRQKNVTTPPENHAILLEDGPSLCLRQKKTWRLTKVNIRGDKSTLVARIEKPHGKGGLEGEHEFTIDGSTRIWRNRELLGIDDLIEEKVWPQNGEMVAKDKGVYLALTWHPRYLYQQFHVSDLWLDNKAMSVATERQRQTHIRHIKTRWMPAMVHSVKHGKFGQAKVTVDLFAGMDASLYADFKVGVGGKMAAAENTLRTWWPDHDGMDGKIVAVGDAVKTRETQKSPAKMVPQRMSGKSGIQVEFEVPLVLEGFRPGRIVRLRPQNWPNVKPPVEERVKGIQDRFPSTDVFRK